MTAAELIQSIRHAAGRGYTVQLTAEDGLALLAEIDRLDEARAEVARLTRERDEATATERAATVAYLKRVAHANEEAGALTRADEARTCAQDLQRGKHRKEA